LIQDGEYVAECYKAEGPKTIFGPKSWKIYLHFRIIDKEDPYSSAINHDGVELYLPLNYADKHGNMYKRVPVGSKLYHALVIAHEGKKPPRRLHNLRIFKNGVFRVKTKTIKRNCDQRAKQEELWYSVIDCLVERIK